MEANSFYSHKLHNLIEPLKNKGNEGIDDVMNFMERYEISKDGRESVIEMGQLNICTSSH
jgi:hypothetical protein